MTRPITEHPRMAHVIGEMFTLPGCNGLSFLTYLGHNNLTELYRNFFLK